MFGSLSRRAGVVGSLSRRDGSGREAIPKFRDWSIVPPGGAEEVGRPSQVARSGREALPEGLSGQEALLVGRVWSAGPLRGPGVVGRPFWRTESGQEAIPNSQEWSGGPPGGLRMI